MKKIKLNNYHKKIFADTITPVEVYLKIRDIYPNSLLLENSDYTITICDKLTGQQHTEAE